jgi:hypothetical protein
MVAALVAVPLDKLTGEPKFAPSTINCTVPVGVVDEEDTVAVKLTEPPTVEGLSDDTTPTVGAILLAVVVWFRLATL